MTSATNPSPAPAPQQAAAHAQATALATALALDHVGVAARDLAPLVAAYQALGFTLSPLAQQSGKRRPDLPVELFGTGNRCAFLQHGYIELIAILDPALFANGLDVFLQRYAGQHILALGMEDAEANLARLRRAGVPIPGVAWLERPLDSAADGPDAPRARFARLPFPDAPEGRVQLIRHLTPELVWNPAWMEHPNKAVALEATILASAAPAETAARFARLAGLPVEPDPAGGFMLRLPGAAGAAGPRSPALETQIRILPPEALPRVLEGVVAPALPFMAGMVVRTADGGKAVRGLAGGMLRPTAGGLLAPPEVAGGVAVLFV